MHHIRMKLAGVFTALTLTLLSPTGHTAMIESRESMNLLVPESLVITFNGQRVEPARLVDAATISVAVTDNRITASREATTDSRTSGVREVEPIVIGVPMFNPEHLLFRPWLDMVQGRTDRAGTLELTWFDREGNSAVRLVLIEAWPSQISVRADGEALITFQAADLQFQR